MKVNEAINWMKNKMKKRLKINLLLDAQCWLFRRASGVYLMAKFERVLVSLLPCFWRHESGDNEESTQLLFACNAQQNKGHLHRFLDGYMALCVLKWLLAFWLLPLWFFLV